jgi:hypothetical protein
MTQEAQKLYEAAVALPEDERATLVMKLLDTIGRSQDRAGARSAESLSRLSAFEAGDLEVIDDDEAMRLIAG